MRTSCHWPFSNQMIIIAAVIALALPSPGSAYHDRNSPSNRRIVPESLPRASGPAAFLMPRLSKASPKSPNAFSILQRGRLFSGELARRAGGKVEGTSHTTVTDEDCRAQGLEKCGDICVAQCCNKESALACPVSAHCTANEEYEFCCQNGFDCEEPTNCMGYDDPQCAGKGGETIIDSDGQERSCCYKGFEVCASIWGGFPACMPHGSIEIPPRPPKPTKTGPFNPDWTAIAPAASTSAPTTEIQHNIMAEHKDTDGDGDIDEDDDNDADDDESKGTDGDKDTDRDKDTDGGDADADGDNEDEDDEDDHKPNGPGTIVGGAIGGALGMAILATAIYFIGRHYRKRKAKAEAELAAANNHHRLPSEHPPGTISPYSPWYYHDGPGMGPLRGEGGGGGRGGNINTKMTGALAEKSLRSMTSSEGEGGDLNSPISPVSTLAPTFTFPPKPQPQPQQVSGTGIGAAAGVGTPVPLPMMNWGYNINNNRPDSMTVPMPPPALVVPKSPRLGPSAPSFQSFERI